MIKTMICTIIVFIMIGCSEIENPEHNQNIESVRFNDEITKVTLYESNDQLLFNIEYQFTNHSDVTLGPFYLNFNFNHYKLSNSLGMEQYTPFKRLGGNQNKLTLDPGKTYQSGISIKFPEGQAISKDSLKELILDNDTVQIQLIDIETESTLISYWIHNFNDVLSSSK